MTLPLSRFITTQSQLEELARELEGSSMLAIDTEFMREKTYYAKLCLLQLNNGTVSAIVDPLAVTDLSPLVPVLTDENCVKIFHAGTQDIAILHHETGVTPSPVFDTQVAASLLGYPLQVGYGPLVRSVCDVKLAKADSYTDWSKRPLTNSQIKYALDDVVYLPRVYECLRDELVGKGRLAWCERDFRALADLAPRQAHFLAFARAARDRARSRRMARARGATPQPSAQVGACRRGAHRNRAQGAQVT